MAGEFWKSRWAPSTASIASKPIWTGNRCVSAEPRKLTFCALKEVAPPQVDGQLERETSEGSLQHGSVVRTDFAPFHFFNHWSMRP